jgi:RHS repeat-associated protein
MFGVRSFVVLSLLLLAATSVSAYYDTTAGTWIPSNGLCAPLGTIIPGSGETTAGDPVDVGTGSYIVSETFFVTPGRIAFPVGWTYRSNDATDGPMGIGTSMTTDWMVRQVSGAGITYGAYDVVAPGGRHFAFYYDSARGGYVDTVDPEMLGAVLTTLPLSLRWKDGTKYSFSGSYSSAAFAGLNTITDRYGNNITISRNTQGYTTSIFAGSLEVAYFDYGSGANRNLLLTYGSQGGPNYWNTQGKLARVQFFSSSYPSGLAAADPGVTAYSAIDPRAYRWWVIRYEDTSAPKQFTSVSCPGDLTDSSALPYYYTPNFKEAFTWYTVSPGSSTMPLLASVTDRRVKNRIKTNYDMATRRVTSQSFYELVPSEIYRGNTTYGFSADISSNTDDTRHQLPSGGNVPEARTERYLTVTHNRIDGLVNKTSAGRWYVRQNHYSGYDVYKEEDAIGRVTLYERRPANISDPNSPWTNLVTKVTTNSGLINEARTEMLWDVQNGNLIQIKSQRVDPTNFLVLTPTTDLVTTISYDSNFSIPNYISFPDGTYPYSRSVLFGIGSTGNIDFVADPKGRYTSFTYYPNGLLKSKTDALSNTTQYSYFGAYLSQIKHPNGTLAGVTTSWNYDSAFRPTSYVDANGNSTSYRYSHMDQLLKKKQIVEVDIDTPSVTQPVDTSFTYDANGNLKTLTNGRNKIWSWDYDWRDRPYQVKNPLNQTRTTTWNDNNDLLRMDDAAGNSVVNTYDNSGALQETKHTKNSVTHSTISYAYDYGFNTYGTGRLLSVTDSLYGSEIFGYDALDRVRSIQTNVVAITGRAALNGTVSMEMDDVGRVTKTLYGGGNDVTYEYDNNDNQIKSNYAGKTTETEYDLLDRVSKIYFPNLTYQQYSYNYSGFIQNISLKRTSDTSNIWYRDYVCDKIGNIIQEFGTGSGGSYTTYKYDKLNQLALYQGAIDKTKWKYDAAGNRVAKLEGYGSSPVVTSYVYDNANRLSSFTSSGSTKSLTYDPAGNITGIGNLSYSWNPRGELTSASTTSYAYDMYGRRIARSNTGVAPAGSFGAIELPSETIGINAVTPSGAETLFRWQDGTVYGDQQTGTSTFDFRWNAVPYAAGSPDSRSNLYAATNQVGSVVRVTDAAGTVAQSLEYKPFGESTASGSATYPTGFTGQEQEPTTTGGLVYMRGRYYNPSLGRFMSEDPIGFGGGINFYAYCGNNPINYNDPYGLLGVRLFGEDFEFDKDTVGNGLMTGLSATASVFSGGLYDGGAYKCQPGFGTSVVLATIGKTSLELAQFASAAGLNRCLWNGCFVEGTEVWMASGSDKSTQLLGSSVPLSSSVVRPSNVSGLKEGDYLASRDPVSGKTSFAKIVTRFERVANEITTVEVRSADGQIEVLRGTPEHPFYVANNGGIVEMGRLGIGTQLVTRAGPAATVVSVKTEKNKEGVKVFNFEIEGQHSYFVGKTSGGLWVHNACDVFEVGVYEVLKKAAKGLGLEIHHLPQANLGAAIAGYDKLRGVAIALPRLMHRGLPVTSRLRGDLSQLAAKEVRAVISQQLRDLAKAGVPADALQKLSLAIRQAYPAIFH